MMADTGSSGEVSDEPPKTSWLARQREMHQLRTEEGMTLTAERVRRLINRHIRLTIGQTPNPGQISKTAAEIRRDAELARAQQHAVELPVAWRQGTDIQQLARTFGLRVRCVRQAIQEIAGSEDRAARAMALRKAREDRQ